MIKVGDVNIAWCGNFSSAAYIIVKTCPNSQLTFANCNQTVIKLSYNADCVDNFISFGVMR